MSDEGKLRKEQDRGVQAQRLLDNEILKDAFEKIESEIDRAWKNSEGRDSEVREHAYYMHRAVQSLRDSLKQVVTTGKFSSHQLLALATNKEKV